MDEQLLPVMDEGDVNILKVVVASHSHWIMHPILIPPYPLIHNKKYLGNTGQDLKPERLKFSFLPQKRRVLYVFIHYQVHQVLSCLQKKKLWVMGCFTSLKYFLFFDHSSFEATPYKFYCVGG